VKNIKTLINSRIILFKRKSVQDKENDDNVLINSSDLVDDLQLMNNESDIEPHLLAEINSSAPSDISIRLKLMGFNGFTYAGFALAFIMIALNNILGYGWASSLLGFNESKEYAVRAPISHLRYDFQPNYIRFESDYDAMDITSDKIIK
jgi:hypothetical protein